MPRLRRRHQQNQGISAWFIGILWERAVLLCLKKAAPTTRHQPGSAPDRAGESLHPLTGLTGQPAESRSPPGPGPPHRKEEAETDSVIRVWLFVRHVRC